MLTVAAALSATACASLGMAKFQEPDIELNTVVVRGLGLTGGTLDLMLDVTNPNNFDLQGTKLDVGLDVEGTHFGDVELEDPFHLPKGELTTVVVPLRFEWGGVGAAARSAMTYGTIKYVLKGTASLKTPFGTEKVPFSRNGSVAVNGARQGAPTGNNR
jgi:LEA14-like dessication related protein